jgi:hypothetical protein
MAAENYVEGLRTILNVVSNPQALRQIQRLPGAAADQVRDALQTFRAVAGSGGLGADIQRKVLFPNAPASRGVHATSSAVEDSERSSCY